MKGFPSKTYFSTYLYALVHSILALTNFLVIN